MEAMTIKNTVKTGGAVLQGSRTIEAQQAAVAEVSVPVGWTGTLITRTNDHAGIIELLDSLPIEAGDKVDIYHAGGVVGGLEVVSFVGGWLTVSWMSAESLFGALPAEDSLVAVCRRLPLQILHNAIPAYALALVSPRRGLWTIEVDHPDHASDFFVFVEAGSRTVLVFEELGEAADADDADALVDIVRKQVPIKSIHFSHNQNNKVNAAAAVLYNSDEPLDLDAGGHLLLSDNSHLLLSTGSYLKLT